MTVSANPEPSALRRILWGLVKIGSCAFVLFFLFMMLMAGIGFGPMGVLISLAFGWLKFLNRTLPQISWNWDLVGMGILCVAVILLLAHRALNWISRSVATARGLTFRWPWRWSWCGLIAVALFFLVGMAVGGATHQIGWLASSEEPWYEIKPPYLQNIHEMRELEFDFVPALLEATTLASLRREMWKSEVERQGRADRRQSLLQSYHVLTVVETDGKVVGVIIFPRSADGSSRVGGYYYNAENPRREVPAKDLPDLIRSYQGKLVAL